MKETHFEKRVESINLSKFEDVDMRNIENGDTGYFVQLYDEGECAEWVVVKAEDVNHDFAEAYALTLWITGTYDLQDADIKKGKVYFNSHGFCHIEERQSWKIRDTYFTRKKVVEHSIKKV